MAFEFTIDISGLEELSTISFQEDLVDTLEDIRAEAETLAPKKTGRLAKSLKKRTSPDGTGEVYSDEEYALAVEIGSEGRPAQPYLRPAYDKHKNALEKRMKKRIEGG